MTICWRRLGVSCAGSDEMRYAIPPCHPYDITRAATGIPLATNHVCGMFGFFFTPAAQVGTYADAVRCDVERFKRFFHGMLDAGVYLAPSAFEAGFVSAAHTDVEIDATIAAARDVFARL